MSKGQTSDERVFQRTGDRELYSSDIAFLLLSADAAMGQRGTLSAVVAAIERGGGAGSSQFDHSTDELLGGMWGRDAAKGELPREGAVARTARCRKRWNALSRQHHETHAAHYLLTIKASGSVRARFAELSGVVILQWCVAHAARRAAGAKLVDARIAEELRIVRAQLEPIEAEIASSTRHLKVANRWAFPPTNPPTRPFEGLAFQIRASLWFLLQIARPLRSRLDALLAQAANVAAHGSIEHDLKALDGACKDGEPKDLRAPAEAAVRAAHRAWYRAGVKIEESRLETA